MGDHLMESLKPLLGFDIVGDVRGKGLFAGIEFVSNKKTKEPVTEQVMNKIILDVASEGVIVGRTNTSIPGMNNIINFAPSLTVTKDQIDQIVRAVETAIRKNI
jgi:taurine-pyruvate aminotransferase